MAETKVSGNEIALAAAADANGWTVTTGPSGKKVWTKSGTVSSLTVGTGLAFINGTITSTPVGLTAANLWSTSYILTESLVLDGGSRHVIPHTIFTNDTGTAISYGLVNTYTGGGWTGSLRYNYRIEEA